MFLGKENHFWKWYTFKKLLRWIALYEEDQSEDYEFRMKITFWIDFRFVRVKRVHPLCSTSFCFLYSFTSMFCDILLSAFPIVFKKLRSVSVHYVNFRRTLCGFESCFHGFDCSWVSCLGLNLCNESFSKVFVLYQHMPEWPVISTGLSIAVWNKTMNMFSYLHA